MKTWPVHALLLLASACTAAPPGNEPFIIQAHRGAGFARPENTLESFEWIRSRYTDIAMAGAFGIFVLSGEATAADVAACPVPPDLVVPNLGELGNQLENALNIAG